MITLNKIWKVIGILATIGGFIGLIFYLIPNKNWAKINNEYLMRFESYNVPDKDIYELFYNISQENEERINSKRWNNYASIILSIYKQLNPHSKIILNDSVTGRITRHKRRVDLTIRQKVAGQDVLLAFKLHPWKSRINKSDLYSYKYLLEDINASKGILIINQEVDTALIGFANRNLISLLNLKDTDSKKWNDEIRIPVYWLQIIPRFYFEPNMCLNANDKIHKDFSRAEFSYNYGIEKFTLFDYLNYKWKNNEISHKTDSLHILYLNTDNLKIKVNKADWRKVNQFKVYYKIDENYWLRYFEPNKFKAIEDHITNQLIISDLEINIQSFKMEESNDWIKLDEQNFDINNFKGLNLIVTANYGELKREDMKIDGFDMRKSD